MRPKSIKQFEILFFVILIAGYLSLALNWNAMMAQYNATPSGAQMGEGFYVTVLSISMAISTLISLLLWFFITRKRSNIARWIYTAFYALGLLLVGWSVVQGSAPGGLQAVMAGASLALQTAAVWLLFRPDSAAWFEKKAPTAPDLEKTFD